MILTIQVGNSITWLEKEMKQSQAQSRQDFEGVRAREDAWLEQVSTAACREQSPSI